MRPIRIVFPLLVIAGSACTDACAQSAAGDADALAKALSNPVAALISVPLQYNYDATYGAEGARSTLNIQPVVPISISEDWNLISRTIVPLIDQRDVLPGRHQFGLGDVVQSAFFSPKAATASGVTWGVGPVAMLPTGTDDLSAETWALGPTAVVLKQDGKWTYGALLNHMVDVGGRRRVDISATFLQPFASRSLGNGRTVAFNLESTYDWHAGQWTVPANVAFSKVSKIGGQMVSYTAGVRAYLDAPEGGPDWGVRLALTLLYPK